jgi:cytochrome oxidase Cu insertion factor (SCO1/SenC/PrrC family)
MMLVAKSKDAPRAATAGGSATTEKPAETALTNLRIPDAAVVDQNGRKLNFYTDLVKGKTVIINFIFTTCTTICPPLTATLRRVQQDLGDHAGRDVHLISISVDPTTDVPERLKEFSAQFKAGPGWTFVTGSKPEIDGLLKALGAFVADRNDHTPMILIGNDAANYWTRTYGLAPASTLIKTIVEAAARSGEKTASASGSAASSGASQTGGATSAKPNTTAPASAGYFPNLVLVTQDNQRVHFYDDLLKGKVVLINFIFTTCQGVCSPMTANLAKVQNYLAEHLGKEVVMISISVDPLTDTPERLKKYADSFKVKPGWYFLTGEKKNVDWVLYKLGGFVEDKQQHSTVLIIGNEATGEWMKVIAMANPTEIAGAVTKLLASKPE